MTAPPTNTVEAVMPCPACGFPDALWTGRRAEFDVRGTTPAGTVWTVSGCHCDPTDERMEP